MHVEKEKKKERGEEEAEIGENADDGAIPAPINIYERGKEEEEEYMGGVEISLMRRVEEEGIEMNLLIPFMDVEFEDAKEEDDDAKREVENEENTEIEKVE